MKNRLIAIGMALLVVGMIVYYTPLQRIMAENSGYGNLPKQLAAVSVILGFIAFALGVIFFKPDDAEAHKRKKIILGHARERDNGYTDIEM